MVSSTNLNISHAHPFVPWFGPIFKHLTRMIIAQAQPFVKGIFVIFINSIVLSDYDHFSIITSEFQDGDWMLPSKPPTTLSLPPTIEACTLLIGLGREARGSQAVAPGRRVSTEESW